MNIQILQQTDPLTVAIDNECNAGVTRLCLKHNLDPLSVAVSMAMLLTRQVAVIDQAKAARLVKAISEEIASNWTNPDAMHRRIALTTELSAIAREKGAAIIEAEEARAAGKIS